MDLEINPSLHASPDLETQSFSHASTDPGSRRESFRRALGDYIHTTGIDLYQNRFAVLSFQERDDVIKMFSGSNRRLTGALNPIVRVAFAFSGDLSEAVGTVSHMMPSSEPFNVTSSGPFATNKSFICWDRYSP
jgi:hypothetical protein